jgi:hypothetical protein
MGENGALSIKDAGGAGKKWLTLANCLEINFGNTHLNTFNDNTLKYVQAQANVIMCHCPDKALRAPLWLNFAEEKT